jgi:hypothetical protein
MAEKFPSLTDKHRAFIERQKMFFTASADRDGRVNLSPKGMDTLRILGPDSVAWLDLTGSGNETSAHLEAQPRLTLMFCAFEGPPLILRLYGTGAVHRRGTDGYAALLPHFDDLPGARQIIVQQIDLVQTSCGYAVPLMDFKAERPGLVKWAEGQGADGLADYRRTKNMVSIDGKPTGWVAE